jgi:hypothetical protein
MLRSKGVVRGCKVLLEEVEGEVKPESFAAETAGKGACRAPLAGELLASRVGEDGASHRSRRVDATITRKK